jgi:exodeoxyribonuclease VII large subunit
VNASASTASARATPGDAPIFTVSRLNRVCRFLLSESLGAIRIEGEISNFAAPASGHLYFSLKDAEAQVRCAMFRPQARLLSFRPKNGDHVLLTAQVSLYEPRGDFQLIVETLEEAGDGALAQAFERLKQKLAAEGLFDATQKKPIPRLPRTVGVITSSTGAAIRDILTVLRRRFPAIEVVLIPVRVQGADAREDIVRALRLANRWRGCDVLIVGRGGGSLEDLWTFNEEAVARAIHASTIPVISAVGHEIDFTISDFVADLRAPTPSAAAEAVSPDREEWLDRLDRLSARLTQSIGHRLRQLAQHTRFLDKRLEQRHPAQHLQTQAQRLDELEARLQRGLRHQSGQRQHRLHSLEARLLRVRQDQRIALLTARCAQFSQRLATAMQRQLEQASHQVARTAQELQAVSPLATLARGYSITTRADTGALLASCRDIEAGLRINSRLRDGQLLSIVESIQSDAPGSPFTP